MWRNGILLTAVVGCGILLCSCGKSVEPPGRSTLVKGEGAVAAPIAPSVPDQSILQDQAQYKPAAFTPPPSKAKEATPVPTGAKTAEAGAGLRKFITDVVSDLQTGKLDRVLDTLDADQAKPLRDDRAGVSGTQKALAALWGGLTEKLGPEQAEQVNAALKEGAATAVGMMEIELVGPDAATVTPNPLANILGPEVSAPAARLVQIGGQWRFQLEAPLTAADVAKIAEYHQNLQSVLKQASAALAQGQVQDLQALLAGLAGASAAPGAASPSAAEPGPEPVGKPEGGKQSP